KAESLVLCALWTMYADRIRSGSLERFLMVSMVDLKYELEKYGLRDPIDKTLMTQILSLFERFNLIDVQGKVGDTECLIKLYPSLQFAMSGKAFADFVNDTKQKMKLKKGQEYEEAEDEQADDDDFDE
ncbi:MAG: DUF4194 domain-containing protein, partial [Phascolarctobacterium sp.]